MSKNETIEENLYENVDEKDIYNDKNELIQISYNKKRLIVDKVRLLEEPLREEIYKLIVKDTNKYTEKLDGIVVNLVNLSEKCIVDIYNYIKYNEDNIIKENNMLMNGD